MAWQLVYRTDLELAGVSCFNEEVTRDGGPPDHVEAVRLLCEDFDMHPLVTAVLAARAREHPETWEHTFPDNRQHPNEKD